MWKKVNTHQELPNGYWDIMISRYLPGYTSSDEVLECDILSRYIDDEEVCEDDLDWLPDSKDEARGQLEQLELELYNEAVEARTNLLRMKWGLRKYCEGIKCCKKFVVHYQYLNDITRRRDYYSFYSLIEGICENYVPCMPLLKVETENGAIDILESLKL